MRETETESVKARERVRESKMASQRIINAQACTNARANIRAVCELRGSRGSHSSLTGDVSAPGNMVCEILVYTQINAIFCACFFSKV